MDSSMSNSTASMSTSMMTPWLHFGNADYLIFKAWQPSSRGAVAGACTGLLLFSILERGVGAYRRTQELRWRANTMISAPRVHSSASKEDGSKASADNSMSMQTRRQPIPPFAPSRDIPRGVIQAIQSTFTYALMLTIMTFNSAYIISVILGLGVGEVMFGRISRN